MFNNAETKAAEDFIVNSLKLEVKQKDEELKQKDFEINLLKNKVIKLISSLKPYIELNSQTKKIQEKALKEIFRKEDVIGHKDEKATRLIKIIREKNIIIKNLERRVGRVDIVNSNINSNWRKKI